MNPDQIAPMGAVRLLPWEQSDLGPYCLQYRLQVREKGRKKVLPGYKRVSVSTRHAIYTDDYLKLICVLSLILMVDVCMKSNNT